MDPLGLQHVSDDDLYYQGLEKGPPAANPPGLGKMVGGAVTVVGSALGAAGLSSFLGPVGVGVGAAGVMYGSDLFWTGVEEYSTGTPQDTRSHEILVEVAGEENADRIDLAVGILGVGHGVWTIGKSGWRFLRYAPGKSPARAGGASLSSSTSGTMSLHQRVVVVHPNGRAGFQAPDGTVYLHVHHSPLQEWLAEQGLWKSVSGPGAPGWRYGGMSRDGCFTGDLIE